MQHGPLWLGGILGISLNETKWDSFIRPHLSLFHQLFTGFFNKYL